MAAIRKVSSRLRVCSQPSQPISSPATIQPMLPATRTGGNCFSGDCMCRIATLLAKARVGMNSSM